MRAATVMLLSLMIAGISGCGSKGGETAGPIRLDVPRRAIPAPGLCRVWLDRSESRLQRLPRSCDGIENVAPLGSRVLYRPDNKSRTVEVRYMSRSHPGEVTGIDLFNIDNGNLVRIIQSYNGR